MDIDIIVRLLILSYMIIGGLLIIRCVYMNKRLLRYVYDQYPEDSKIIRSYEHGSRSKLITELKALIKKKGDDDPELVIRARKLTHSYIGFLIWCLLLISVPISSFIYRALS